MGPVLLCQHWQCLIFPWVSPHMLRAKQQIAVPLHPRGDSDAPGPRPAEDGEAFEVQIVDRKPGGPAAESPVIKELFGENTGTLATELKILSLCMCVYVRIYICVCVCIVS